jgi:hypothetical protein
MIRIAGAAAVVLGLAASVSASPIVFGASWDGTPPGTLATVTGLDGFSTETADFAAGAYTVVIDGGYTAWWNLDTVGADGQTLCMGTCTVPQTIPVLFSMPWMFWATTPSYTHWSQFAIRQTSTTTWAWGLEDIQLAQSDADYQDVFGTLTWLDPPCADCTINPLTPVPEPTFGYLAGAMIVGLYFWRRV